MPRTKKKKGWAGSDGRRILRQDIIEGRVTADMDEDLVFAMHPEEFNVGTDLADAKRLFEGRLKAARKYVADRDARANEEEALFHQDRQKIPAPATDRSGEPRWEGSAAQEALKQDIEEGLHLTMTKDELYNSRSVYKDFSKKTISQKTRQIISTNKFLAQYRGRY